MKSKKIALSKYINTECYENVQKSEIAQLSKTIWYWASKVVLIKIQTNKSTDVSQLFRNLTSNVVTIQHPAMMIAKIASEIKIQNRNQPLFLKGRLSKQISASVSFSIITCNLQSSKHRNVCGFRCQYNSCPAYSQVL